MSWRSRAGLVITEGRCIPRGLSGAGPGTHGLANWNGSSSAQGVGIGAATLGR